MRNMEVNSDGMHSFIATLYSMSTLLGTYVLMFCQLQLASTLVEISKVLFSPSGLSRMA